VLCSRAMQRNLIPMILIAAMASADERNAAREHYARGTTAFDLGQFDDAVREYTEAYKLRDDPALLYNIAQSNRLAGHKLESLHFYKIYLTKVPRTPMREEVLAKIAELQKAVEQEKHAQTMPPNEAIAPGAKAPPVETHVEPAASPAPWLPVAPPVKTVDRRGRTLEIGGAATAAVGLACAIGGLAAALIAKNAADALNQAAAAHQSYDPSQYSTLQADRLAAGVLFGIGGAALIGGVATLAVGVKRAHRPVHLVLRPTGAAVEGRF